LHTTAIFNADKLLEDGNTQGNALWLKILDAVQNPLSEERPDETAFH